MKGLWGGISGVIEGNENPLHRAKTEIFEETSVEEKQISLLKTAEQLQVRSERYTNHQWTIFPFLFEVKEPRIRLNWENSDYKWIGADELSKYHTVPSLDEVLARLL
jgi:8-oxo-dGTP pyrophosphatase MutT (NUDIX family)